MSGIAAESANLVADAREVDSHMRSGCRDVIWVMMAVAGIMLSIGRERQRRSNIKGEINVSECPPYPKTGDSHPPMSVRP